MKKLLLIITLTISPILTQCDWNEDGVVDVLDVVSTVDCIMSDCWDNIGTTVMDIDGNVYQTVAIGDQTWMAENLKVTHYNNGDDIPTGFTDDEWINLDDTETGAFAVYDEDPANADTFGNLYNWSAVNDSRGICPEGYHVPSDEEWMELESYLGVSELELYQFGSRGTDQGSQLAGNIDLWYSGELVDNPSFNSSGFVAIPGGCRPIDTWGYQYMSGLGFFWSSSGYSSIAAWGRLLSSDNSEVFRYLYSKQDGLSIHCVRDAD